MMNTQKQEKIAIVGLGYVGLPLAVAFGIKRQVIGYDINKMRINELKRGIDRTREVSQDELKEAKFLHFSADLADIKEAQIFIITAPTPIDSSKKPDLAPLLSATRAIASVLKKGDIVIYESTVYPGCTEEECVPILETSGLKFNIDFFCGYSPERINPGDKTHRLKDIKKITSGSTENVALKIDSLYNEIITAGTHRASSIKVAEAAKVIENAQRDINIAFVNELALIFARLGIDTHEVLEAAGSKWNFLPFKPGLVGGHCIGVDPYYLTHKVASVGYTPQVILSGRQINDNMGVVVAARVIKLLARAGAEILGAKVAILGATFKENCPDVRNSRVIDVIKELCDFGCSCEIFDPNADSEAFFAEYGLKIADSMPHDFTKYNAVVLCVGHREFCSLEFGNLLKTSKGEKCVVFDVKGVLARDLVNDRL